MKFKSKKEKIMRLMLGVLFLIKTFINSAVITAAIVTIAGNGVTELAEALTLNEMFTFAKSKGLKGRINIDEYERLTAYDEDEGVKNKVISDICEQYKTSEILECLNKHWLKTDKTATKSVAVFLDRIVHGLEPVDYTPGIEEIFRYLTGDENDIKLHNKGFQYINGFIVQQMLRNSACWYMCWTIEQNYNNAVCEFIEFLLANGLDVDRDNVVRLLEKHTKKFVLSLFEGSEVKPISDLEKVIYRIRQQVIREHKNKYASKKSISPSQVTLEHIQDKILEFKDNYCNVNINDVSSIWNNLRTPKQILECVQLLDQKLMEMKELMYKFESMSRNATNINAKGKDSNKERNLLGVEVRLLDTQISLKLEELIAFGDIPSIVDGVYPELTLTLSRLVNVPNSKACYSDVDLNLCDNIPDLEDDFYMLESFDYEGFYLAMSQIENNYAVRYKPKELLELLKELFEQLFPDENNIYHNRKELTSFDQKLLTSISVASKFDRDFDLSSYQLFNVEDDLLGPLKEVWERLATAFDLNGFLPKRYLSVHQELREEQ